MRSPRQNLPFVGLVVSTLLLVAMSTSALADPYGIEFRQGPTTAMIGAAEYRVFHSKMFNVGDNADSYTMTVTRVNPDDWYFNVCYDGGCFPTLDPVTEFTIPMSGTVAPGGEIVFDFDVISSAVEADAQLIVEIVSNQDPSVGGTWTYDVMSPQDERAILFATGEGVQTAGVPAWVQFHPRFYNAGTTDDSYTWSIDQNLPAGWSTAFCYDGGCYLELTGQMPYGGQGTIPPGGEVAIDVDFSIVDLAPSGSATVTIVSNTDPSLWSAATFIVVTGSVVGVEDLPGAVLSDAKVAPNPFNPKADILFTVGGTDNQDVLVDIYDVTGRRVRSLQADDLAPGPQSVAWDGRGDDGRTVAAGIYLANVRAGTAHQAVKMSLVK